jgi:hypothetical protein
LRSHFNPTKQPTAMLARVSYVIVREQIKYIVFQI